MNCQFFKLNSVNQDRLFFQPRRMQNHSIAHWRIWRWWCFLTQGVTKRALFKPYILDIQLHQRNTSVDCAQQDMQQSSGQETAVVSFEIHLPAVVTFRYSLQPNLFIPTLQRFERKAVSKQERPVWCITKCRENNLLYETVGGFSAQTPILSLLHLSTWLRCNWGGDYLKQNICSF